MNFSGTHIVSLEADGLQVADSLYMKGIRAEGEVRMLGAGIGGALDCDGSIFSNSNGDALNADAVTVGGSVHWGGLGPRG